MRLVHAVGEHGEVGLPLFQRIPEIFESLRSHYSLEK